jgi:hypothetical protein
MVIEALLFSVGLADHCQWSLVEILLLVGVCRAEGAALQSIALSVTAISKAITLVELPCHNRFACLWESLNRVSYALPIAAPLDEEVQPIPRSNVWFGSDVNPLRSSP